MRNWKNLTGSTAMMLILAGSAQADVTAQEVWDNFKAASSGMGQTITPGSESMDGDTLTVRDVALSMINPDATINATIDTMAFTENGDGTVTVTMSPSYGMALQGEAEDGTTFSADLAISQPNISMDASGGDGTVTYDFSAPEIGIDVTNLMVDGTAVEGVMRLAMAMATGTYVVTEGDDGTIESDFAADQAIVTVSVKEPEGGAGTFDMSVDMADITGSSTGSMGMMSSLQNMQEALESGFATNADLGHGAASYSIAYADSEENFNLSAQSSSGSLGVSLDETAMSYDVGTTGFSFTASGSDIPLPEVSAKLNEFGFAFLLPISETEEPADFGLNVTLDGLSVSDMIWGMVDPGGALNRDPATLIVDLTGKAKMFFNLMDPESAEAMNSEVPGEVYSLDLNELRFAAGGADLTGTGAFTFDNTDLETFDGIPAPTGSIDLQLVGANQLIDTLVSMGLLPEDQAMGARMMMGLFARPGDGPDTLVSKIEVKGDGSISANGQRLQ